MDQSAALACDSIATMGTSHTVSEINGDFSRKIAIFSHLPVFNGLPWNWVPAHGGKARMMGLTGREIYLTLPSAVWIQYTNVTDRWTVDGQTLADSKDALTRIVAR